MTTIARELVDAMTELDPEVVELARYMSIAAWIEPALLRRARLTFLPTSEPGLEADLWFSPFVKSRSPRGLVLHADVAELLRRELDPREGGTLKAARDLIEEAHRGAAWALQLEELVTYVALADRPDARSLIESHLQRVVTIMRRDRTRIDGLAAWIERAFPRLPAETQGTEAFAGLAVAASTILGVDPIVDAPALSERMRAWLRQILPPDLGSVPVGLRLFPSAIEVCDPGSEGAHVVNVPRTQPTWLEVVSDLSSRLAPNVVELSPGRNQTVGIGPGGVTVRTGFGDAYQVRPIRGRATATSGGLTVRAVAGTHGVILGMDLGEDVRPGCLGFSIRRTDLGSAASPLPPDQRKGFWFHSPLRFPDDTSTDPATTERSPIQKFRWGDYTIQPGYGYRYRVVAQYGQWSNLVPGAAVEVDVVAEDPSNPNSAVFFNRGAAASEAYVAKFGDTDPGRSPEARAWLSRGLEEALLAFLAQAKDSTFALHAAIYEFQKPELLQGLKAALDRGAEVKVVYHHRKANPRDDTWSKNEKACTEAGLAAVAVQRNAPPSNASSYNKFVVLLQSGTPIAAWTGSTNWTDGAIYGQLNVGHAFYDSAVAATYEKYFQLLHADPGPEDLKKALANVTPVPAVIPDTAGAYPIFSPQSEDRMLQLYASICEKAHTLMVCAPFELAPGIRATLEKQDSNSLHFLLLDKTGALGDRQTIDVIEKETDTQVAVATSLPSVLHDYQNRILEGKESFHHAGVHIHAKFIVADPFGPDPTVVTGSATFSDLSFRDDDNAIIIRGNTAVADIYAIEFMRMFEHYLFRGKSAAQAPLGLVPDDSWSASYYVPGSMAALSRQMFAGTLT